MPYLRIGLLLALLAGASYGAWWIRDGIAEREVLEARDEAMQAAQRQIDEERKQRQHYQKLADQQLIVLVQEIGKLQADAANISAGIAKEREANRKFYQQALPAGGYEQWKKARLLLGPSSAASAVQ